MARSLTAGMQTELAAAAKRPVILYEGEFADGFVRFWSGVGTKTWNGETWTGAGWLGGISPIVETGGVKAKGMTVTLSGVPSDLISTVLGQSRRTLPGRLWLGFLDASDNVIADPFKCFEGRLDRPVIEDGAETATISIAYENRLIDLEHPRVRRFTAEDQQIDYPGDKGFDFVPACQEWNGKWGQA